MSCYLFELQFLTPVHFGDSASAKSLESSSQTVCADTFFSALCQEANRAEGETGVRKLADAVVSGKLRLTDLFPYRKDDLFLPRPVFPPKAQLLADPNNRKKLKKLAWIPVSELDAYCRGVSGEGTIEPERLCGRFGEACPKENVSLHGLEQSLPYTVGRFLFDEGCGLYGIAEGSKETLDFLRRLLGRLGYTGLGGKLSSGCGKFAVRKEITSEEAAGNLQAEALFHAMAETDAPAQLLLTTSLPCEDEMAEAVEGAFYSVKRRGGFVQSSAFAQNPQKKQTQYFLTAGSVLRRRFTGGLQEVSLRPGPHPVYRYSAPLFLGEKL